VRHDLLPKALQASILIGESLLKEVKNATRSVAVYTYGMLVERTADERVTFAKLCHTYQPVG